MANNSYILDSEIPSYFNEGIFRELCTVGLDSPTVPESSLSGSRLGRAEAALNFGKDFVDTQLRGAYSIPFTDQASVSTSWPSPMVKVWNARATMLFFYELLHFDRRGDDADSLEKLAADIEQYTKPGGRVLAGHDRNTNPNADLIYGNSQTGSYFDLAGAFAPEIIEDDQNARYRGI